MRIRIRLDLAIVTGLTIGIALGYLILHADSLGAWLSRASVAVGHLRDI
jgi:hypothetical protein